MTIGVELREGTSALLTGDISREVEQALVPARDLADRDPRAAAPRQRHVEPARLVEHLRLPPAHQRRPR
jgi:hypothetical protein